MPHYQVWPGPVVVVAQMLWEAELGTLWTAWPDPPQQRTQVVAGLVQDLAVQSQLLLAPVGVVLVGLLMRLYRLRLQLILTR
jgi:hypothetical protein